MQKPEKKPAPPAEAEAPTVVPPLPEATGVVSESTGAVPVIAPMSGKLHRATTGFAAARSRSPSRAPLAAQTMSNTFGGLSESSDEPIDIESDLLVVHDKQKYATFSGNVKAVQGTTTLRAKELLVHYIGGDTLSPGGKKDELRPRPRPRWPTPKARPACCGGDQAAYGAKAKDGDTQITKIEAKGDVVINSDDDQTTTSDWALYDLPSQMVTVGGNVVLTQGKNVLKGDRLVIDLKTGESRFENTGNTAAGGRIRALFMPKQNGGEDGSRATPSRATPNLAKPSRAARSLATAKHEARRPEARHGPERKGERMTAGTPSDPFIPEMRAVSLQSFGEC